MTRIWVGPADAEHLGDDDEGTPVLGNDEGAGPMTDIGAYVRPVGFSPVAFNPDEVQP